jgi:hypothetical protein
VLAHVQEDVRECVPDLARRSQQAQVVAAEQHRPFPPEHAIHGSREPRRHRLHPARQGILPAGLHDQVQMIALDRVVADAELSAIARLAETSLEFRERDGDCEATEYRAAREALHARGSATVTSGALRDESAVALKRACARHPGGVHRAFGTPEPAASIA